MGNPGYINITKWGTNLHWYRYGYESLFNSTLNIKIRVADFMFRILLRFGSYWSSTYSNKNKYNLEYKKQYRLYTQNQFNHYFYIFNSYNGDEIFLKYRLRRFNFRLFFSRVWFLRYRGWIFLITHVFHIIPDNQNRLATQNQLTKNKKQKTLYRTNNNIKFKLTYLHFLFKNIPSKHQLYTF